MKISLWQLNESYQALIRLAQSEFPKDKHKLAYKLSRIIRSAKTEIETLSQWLNELMVKCGFEPGAQDVPPERLKDYNETAKAFMNETLCEVWGDPIKFEEIAGAVAVSPFDLAALDWLIIEGDSTEGGQ